MRFLLLLIGLSGPFYLASAQDVSLPANFGEIELNSGFLPDPYVVNISAGGGIDASIVDNSCIGFVSEAPDLQVSLNSAFDSILFLALSEADISLVVNAPNGDWRCDDDSGDGLNPLLEFSSGVTGVFDIWVGSVGEQSNPDAVIVISELGSTSLLSLSELESTFDTDITSDDATQDSSVYSGQSQFSDSDYSSDSASLSPDQIAQCSMDIQSAQVNSGFDTASIIDLYTYQIELFEGDCAGHPEAEAYIENGRRFLAEALDSDVDSGSDQQATSSASSTPTDRDYGDRSRVIAGDGESAMDCAALVEIASRDSNLTGGNRVIANNCGETIEITWCYVGEGRDGCGAGGLWTLHSGGSWPVSSEKEIRWAACRGKNTVGFEEGSMGLRYICSAPL